MPIHIDHLYKVLGKQEILHDICLNIEDGEVVGLIGPNGTGKSTLMKIILGLWEPTSGTITAPTTRGYLPELNPMYEYMYVREYLGMMERLRLRSGQSPKEREQCPLGSVEEMMERVGLMPMAHKRIGELSKGYRQRVGIAQALLGNPELVILDEPTTGLDPNQVVEIRRLIGGKMESESESESEPCGARNERGITILSTHRLEDVKEVCSRVIILDRGSVKYDSAERLKGGEAERLKGEELEEIFRQVTNYGK